MTKQYASRNVTPTLSRSPAIASSRRRKVYNLSVKTSARSGRTITFQIYITTAVKSREKSAYRTCCPHGPQAVFVVTSSHWIDISCASFVWARSIFELDVKGDNPHECDRAANRRPCGVLSGGNHFCQLAHGN